MPRFDIGSLRLLMKADTQEIYEAASEICRIVTRLGFAWCET